MKGLLGPLSSQVGQKGSLGVAGHSSCTGDLSVLTGRWPEMPVLPGH